MLADVLGRPRADGPLIVPLLLGVFFALCGVAYWRSAREGRSGAGTRVHQVGAVVMIALGAITALGSLLRLLVTG